MPERRRKGPEQETSLYTNLHIEPGHHQEGVSESPIAPTEKPVWNRQVAERIAVYSPQVLAVDGMTPFLSIPFIGEDNIPGIKQSLWNLLPARPTLLNNTGEIVVVAGDPGWYYQFSLAGLAQREHSEDRVIQLEELQQSLFAIGQSEYEQDAHGNKATIIRQAAGITAAATAALEELVRTSERLVPVVLMQLSAVLAARALFGAGIVPHMAALSKSPRVKEKLEKYFDYWAPRPQKLEWVNFRTALLIDKAEDTIDRLGLPKNTPSAVVLGYHHGFQSGALAANPDYRREIIENYMTSLIGTVEIYLDELPDVPREEVINGILDYMSLTDILKVSDTDSSVASEDIPDHIDETVTLEDSFHSPRVEEATNSLRPAA